MEASVWGQVWGVPSVTPHLSLSRGGRGCKRVSFSAVAPPGIWGSWSPRQEMLMEQEEGTEVLGGDLRLQRESNRGPGPHNAHKGIPVNISTFRRGSVNTVALGLSKLCVLLAAGASLNRTRQKNTQLSRISLLPLPNSRLTDREGDQPPGTQRGKATGPRSHSRVRARTAFPPWP